ncbi:MAG: STAS domain-containing protein [Rhodospirillales bacterium]|nr:STAS domain-containing protein [Rhodospirillales bacterium]
MEYTIESSGKTREIHLVGDLKFGDDQFVDALTALLDEAAVDRLVIDLSRLVKLDSYGIGILLKAQQLAVERHKSMAVRGVGGSIAELFATFRLAETLTVIDG